MNRVGVVIGAVLSLAIPVLGSIDAGATAYTWRDPPVAATETLSARIAPPAGFARVPVAPGSFAAWLRGLPLKPAGSPVLLYTGTRKVRQDAHVAVVDIDVGTRDLQQCADAIMRLRAEWLWSAGRRSEIAFNDTDGTRRSFSATGGSDYGAFRKYLTLVFAYAGTYSLERELVPVADAAEVDIGDVFIKGGFPGHAVLVADVAVDPAGTKRVLLMQSYMPAQDIHVLANPANPDGSSWYEVPAGTLATPEWVFPARSLRRWPEPRATPAITGKRS